MNTLLGGAECGPSNPLKQISQREGVDNSLFKDRLASQSGPSRPNAFQHSVPNPALQTALHRPLHANPTPHPFNLSYLSAALSESRSGNASPAPASSTLLNHGAFESMWNEARMNNQQLVPPPSMPVHTQTLAGMRQAWAHQDSSQSVSAWANNFEGHSSAKGKERALPLDPTVERGVPESYGLASNGDHLQMLGFMPRFGTGLGGYNISGRGMYQGEANAAGMMNTPRDGVQLDAKQMDDLFAQAESDFKATLTSPESTTTINADDVKSKQPESVKEQDSSQKEEKVDTDLGEEVKDAKGDFDKVWESLKPEAERLGKLAEWEKDFSQFTNNEDDLFKILDESLNRPDVGQNDLDQQFGFLNEGNTERTKGLDEGMLIREDGIPNFNGYDFSPQPDMHKSLSASHLWAQASHILASGGALSEATSLLEAFIQQSTPQDRAQMNVSLSEAWATLGRVHAMDEKEEKALCAFQEGRKALEEEGTKGKEKVAGEMLTNLAISYVNESLDLAALSTLHTFLELLHPSYAGPKPSTSSPLLVESYSPWVLHQQMTDSFLDLARQQYGQGGQVDPDVQVGLGTLFYMMGEYDQARDCWVAALKERPDDYLLWNRLGATLANGGSSEEAVDAYRRALELKPTFTRAISNLGVACMNIGVHREAVEHFLAALSLHPLHQSDSQDARILNDSASLWSTLRKSLIAMNLSDLAQEARPGMDLEVFRKAGFDF
ncbi:hypothetical protein L204_102542 [Cryptococcus depauperatus]|nr:peroxisome targeting signal receptor [Cryptococcus depauperatus CBS 7855]